MPQVALALSRLRERQFFIENDDLVFASEIGSVLNYAPQPEAASKLGALVGELLTEATRLRSVS